jgi:hypothetical protein
MIFLPCSDCRPCRHGWENRYRPQGTGLQMDPRPPPINDNLLQVFFAPERIIFHFPLEIHQKILNINYSNPSF